MSAHSLPPTNTFYHLTIEQTFISVSITKMDIFLDALRGRLRGPAVKNGVSPAIGLESGWLHAKNASSPPFSRRKQPSLARHGRLARPTTLL
jgi:hypothetical protein